MHIVVVQTAYLGDLVLTTPLLRELRRVRPLARLTVVTSPAGAELFRMAPWVDDIRIQRKRPWLASLGPTRRTARWLRHAGVDVAIAAHRSHRSAWVLRQSRARRIVGFDDAPGRWAYHEHVHRDPNRHAVLRYLALSEPLGGDLRIADPRPELQISERAERSIDRALAEAAIDAAEPLLCLAPGSVWPTKRWRPDGFAALTHLAVTRGLRPVLVGAADEQELCGSVLQRSHPITRSLAGRTGIEELAALLARARGLVGNDSGPAHLASAVRTPVVSIYGPTSPASGLTPFGGANRFAELDGLACRPCGRHGARRCPRGHFRCMLELGVDRVAAQLEAALQADERVA